jgi:hypothetical protein
MLPRPKPLTAGRIWEIFSHDYDPVWLDHALFWVVRGQKRKRGEPIGNSLAYIRASLKNLRRESDEEFGWHWKLEQGSFLEAFGLASPGASRPDARSASRGLPRH